MARLLHRVDLARAAPVKCVPELRRPVLFIHGAEDDYVPPEHARRLRAASSHPDSDLWLVPGAGHAETYRTAPDEFIARIERFFEREMT
jgi:fermentation-respiration switch protein FrsA (DUF1100 family)